MTILDMGTVKGGYEIAAVFIGIGILAYLFFKGIASMRDEVTIHKIDDVTNKEQLP